MAAQEIKFANHMILKLRLTSMTPVESQSPSRVRAGRRRQRTGARGPQWPPVQRGRPQAKKSRCPGTSKRQER